MHSIEDPTLSPDLSRPGLNAIKSSVATKVDNFDQAGLFIK